MGADTTERTVRANELIFVLTHITNGFLAHKKSITWSEKEIPIASFKDY